MLGFLRGGIGQNSTALVNVHDALSCGTLGLEVSVMWISALLELTTWVHESFNQHLAKEHRRYHLVDHYANRLVKGER